MTTLFSHLTADLDKKARLLYGTPTLSHRLAALFQRSTLATAVYRFGRFANEIDNKLLKIACKITYYIFFYLVQGIAGISIQAYANIGKRLVVNNYSAIFLVAEKIGDDFTVSEGVTVGNIRGKSRLAIIGNNVTLEPGCKVLGDVTIGDNVIVRANSLVLTDIPANSIAMGNPARIKPIQ